MNLAEARLTIEDTEAGYLAHLAAVEVVKSSPESTLADLLACLKLTSEGIVPEVAAAELYRRTGRELPARMLDWSADHGDWEQFLSGRRLID
jgi:hypothetical protein